MDALEFAFSLLGGIGGAAILFVLRDLILIPSRARKKKRYKQVQRQLEKLYSPLYILIRNTRLLSPGDEPNIAYISDPVDFKGGVGATSQGKRDLDRIILDYGYLADDELAKILAGLVGAAYYQADINTPEVRKRLVDLIESGYDRLRKEYFAEK